MRNFKIEDFKGSGQYLVANREKIYSDTGYLSTLLLKVGYRHGKNSCVLISMSDGWVQEGYFNNEIFIPFEGKESLVQYLNNPELCKEEYRFATQEEVVRVVLNQSSRWRNN